MKRKDDKVPTEGQPKLQHSPFAQLGALRQTLPAAGSAGIAAVSAGPSPAAAILPPAQSAGPAAAKPVKPGPARAVVRYERKGRGGKEVTVVEQLPLPAKELDAWLKALKSALGCGGLVEDGSLVLQGDQRKRLPALLEARGVRKITVSQEG